MKAKFLIISSILVVSVYVINKANTKEDITKLSSGIQSQGVSREGDRFNDGKSSLDIATTGTSEKSPELVDESPELKEKKEKVKLALQEFEKAMNKISRDDLENEQEQMQEAKIKMKQEKVSPPKEELIKDKNGLSWTKLTYEDGTVRYDFPKS